MRKYILHHYKYNAHIYSLLISLFCSQLSKHFQILCFQNSVLETHCLFYVGKCVGKTQS